MSKFVDVKVVLRETLDDLKPVYDITQETYVPSEVVLSVPTSGIVAFSQRLWAWIRETCPVWWDLGEQHKDREDKPRVATRQYALGHNGTQKAITAQTFPDIAKALQEKKIAKVIVVWAGKNSEPGQVRYQPFEDRIKRIQLAIQRITWAKLPAQSKLVKVPTDVAQQSYTLMLTKSKYFQRYLDLTYQRDWNRGKNLLASPEMKWVSNMTIINGEKALENANPRLAKGGWPTQEQLTKQVGPCWRIR